MQHLNSVRGKADRKEGEKEEGIAKVFNLDEPRMADGPEPTTKRRKWKSLSQSVTIY